MVANNLSISGLTVYTENDIKQNGSVIIQDGKIRALAADENFPSAEEIKFPANYHLIPGFIDMHVHGANNKDVMDGDEAALIAISQALAAEGTTSFLATTMTAAPEHIEKVLLNARAFTKKEVKGANLLGVHLEGPFISPKKIGAQRSDKIIAPNIDFIKKWQQISDNIIKLVTLAPEEKNALELIRYLQQEKIVASIGHTDASFAETQAGIDAGCTHVTHLFNAMRGIHQREPGTVTAALLSDKVWAEMIVDGLHLHPAIINLALRLKTAEKLILVTDAMRAKCLGDGCYDLGGQPVTVKNNVATLADGTLAGSVLKMSTAIRNMLKFTSCSMQDLIKMTSTNPAQSLGIQTKGSITVGKDADLVVLDDQFNLVMTVKSGEVIYEVDYARCAS